MKTASEVLAELRQVAQAQEEARNAREASARQEMTHWVQSVIEKDITPLRTSSEAWLRQLRGDVAKYLYSRDFKNMQIACDHCRTPLVYPRKPFYLGPKDSETSGSYAYCIGCGWSVYLPGSLCCE